MVTKHYHAVVWLDHQQAKIFSLNSETAEEWTVRPHDSHVHLHHKAGSRGGAGKAAEDPHYFHGIAAALSDAGEILIVGPGVAKQELRNHIEKHDPAVAKKVVGVETLDHPSDGELINFARRYFRKVDRTLPQRG